MDKQWRFASSTQTSLNGSRRGSTTTACARRDRHRGGEGVPADALTITRLQACHTKLVYGLSLDTAIAEVVAEIQCAPGNPMLTAARP